MRVSARVYVRDVEYVAPPMRAFLPDTLLLTAPITPSPSASHHPCNHRNHRNVDNHRLATIAIIAIA